MTAAVIVVLCKFRQSELKRPIVPPQPNPESESNSASNTVDSDAPIHLSLELGPREKEYFNKKLPPRPEQANGGGKYSVEDIIGADNDASEDNTYSSMSDIASGESFAQRYPNSETSAN